MIKVKKNYLKYVKHNFLLDLFANKLMSNGEKVKAYKILIKVFKHLKTLTDENSFYVFLVALLNASPSLSKFMLNDEDEIDDSEVDDEDTRHRKIKKIEKLNEYDDEDYDFDSADENTEDDDEKNEYISHTVIFFAIKKGISFILKAVQMEQKNSIRKGKKPIHEFIASEIYNTYLGDSLSILLCGKYEDDLLLQDI